MAEQMTIWCAVDGEGDAGANRPRRKDWRWAIPDLLAKAGHRCLICGGAIKGTGGAHVWVEHVKPLARGGRDELGNLGVSHPTCNTARSDRLLDDPWIAEHRARLKALAAKPLKARECIDCGAGIADKGAGACLCDGCVAERGRAYKRSVWASNRPNRPARSCVNCGTDITMRHSCSLRCKACATERERLLARVRRAANRDEINARLRAKRAAKKPARSCLDCGADITMRSPKALRCASCKAGHERKLGRNRYAAKRPNRSCLDCGVNINHRGSQAKRCEACAVEHKRGYRREWDRDYRQAKRPARSCLDCGADITDRDGNARRCEACVVAYKREYMRATELVLHPIG